MLKINILRKKSCLAKAAYILLTLGSTLLLSGCKLAVLDPKGWVAAEEKHLILITTVLMLLVVIPVIIMTIVFAIRFRASNKKAIYRPEWSHSTALEVIWWGVPCLIIAVLATITWITTHRLDPFKPLDAPGKPLTIQVVALDWKWLFIYPEQHIATINFVQIPVDRPVTFDITADAPMNAFAVPQLGGQIYAMAGMRTQLHLIANETGDFRGLSTNYSGEGFAQMRFTVRASSEAAFEHWVSEVKHQGTRLDKLKYRELFKPSIAVPVTYFQLADDQLFRQVIEKYTKLDEYKSEQNAMNLEVKL